MNETYVYEPYVDPRTTRNPAGYIIFRRESGVTPTDTSVGYARDLAEVLKFYPSATRRP